MAFSIPLPSALLLLALFGSTCGLSLPDPERRGDRNPPPSLGVQEESFESSFPPSFRAVGGLKWSDVTVERTVEGLGFHRTAVTSVNAKLQDGVEAKGISRCEVMMVERISKDVYYDLDELTMHEPFGGVTYFSFEHFIDVEKPAEVSAEHRLGIKTHRDHVSLVSDAAGGGVGSIRASFRFPVHVRYQSPSRDEDADGYSDAPIYPPLKVYIACEGTKGQSKGQGQWTPLSFKPGRPVLVPVPVGKLDHQDLVNFGTFIGVLVGFLIILKPLLNGNGVSD
jgi:hypothetical protein